MESSDRTEEKQQPKEPQQKELIPSGMLEGLPPSAKHKITQAIEWGFSMQRTPFNPLTEKMTPEHVGQFLNMIDEDNKREYKDAAENRKYWLIVFCIIVALFAFFTVFFVYMKETSLLTQILTIAIAIGGGFGSGYGFCKARQK